MLTRVLAHDVPPVVLINRNSDPAPNFERSRDKVDRVQVPTQDLAHGDRRPLDLPCRREEREVSSVRVLSSPLGEQDCSGVSASKLLDSGSAGPTCVVKLDFPLV